MTDKKIAKAARNALAYLHITGWMPQYIKQATWSAVYRCVQGPVDQRTVKPECLHYIEGHPMIAAVERMKSEGWKIGDLSKRRIRSGIPLVRDGLETHIYLDGRQGHVWRI